MACGSFQRSLAAGPFEIPQLPVATGGGTISVALTDALGRQTVTDLPFYAGAGLLAPGLQTYSIQAGAIRRNWGLASFDYGALAASASYRRGISSRLTLETSLEAKGSTAMAGAGAVFNLNNQAVINGSIALSTSRNGGGSQFSVGFQRLGTILSLGANAVIASKGFRDIAAASYDAPARLRVNASAGVALGRFSTLGLAYAGIEQDGDAVQRQPGSVTGRLQNFADALQPALRVHIVSANYGVQLGRVSIFATGFRDFASRGNHGVQLGLTMPLGRASSASINAGTGPGGSTAQFQASRSVQTVGDFGYQVFADTGSQGYQFGEFQYMSGAALVSAGLDHNGTRTTARASARGSVSLVDGGVFASNTITDSFAIVDTNGLANVRVLRENREVGRTDANGKLLVPELRSFDINRITIDPSDVPFDASIPIANREVRPMDRSGVIIKFPVRVSRAALLRLVDETGVVIPIGSTARLRTGGALVPVGYDGAAYLEDLAANNDVVVEKPDGQRCGVRFAYRPVAGEIPSLGPLMCRKDDR